MTERRVLVAGVISLAFLALYTQFLGRQYPNLKKQSSISPRVDAGTTKDHEPQLSQSLVFTNEPEETFEIASSRLRLEIGKNSGAIKQATLPEYPQDGGIEPIRFGMETSLLSIRFPEETSRVLTGFSSDSASFQVETSKGCKHTFSYSIKEEKSSVELVIATSGCPEGTNALLSSGWTKSGSNGSVQNNLEWVALIEQPKGGGRKHIKKQGHLGKPHRVLRRTVQLTLAERFFCQSAQLSPAAEEAEFSSASQSVAIAKAQLSLKPAADQLVTLYLGPRDYFHVEKAGFGDTFSIGILGRIGLMLLAVLSWIAGMTHNYGVAIILFSSLITLLMAPFTLISLRSMKKMQVIQPQIKVIMEKHKGDQAKANQEVFALYREHRVSPMSGCLPILLQWPILIALLQAITSYISLRGQSFLWIKDLSLPDHIANLPFTLPFLGAELNLLPILMAGAMYIQTFLSQRGTPVDKSNPTAAMMSGPLMPVLFGVMLYHVPAGLVLYWLSNSVLGIALYRFAVR
jgi:YidC/Oxa1 family membrane protein insertase